MSVQAAGRRDKGFVQPAPHRNKFQCYAHESLPGMTGPATNPGGVLLA